MPNITKVPLGGLAQNVVGNVIASGVISAALVAWGKVSQDWNWPAISIMGLFAFGGAMAAIAALQHLRRQSREVATNSFLPIVPSGYPALVTQTKEHYEALLERQASEFTKKSSETAERIALLTKQRDALNKKVIDYEVASKIPEAAREFVDAKVASQEAAKELAALKRLVSATSSEDEFLDLFVTGEIRMVHEKQDTWLSHVGYIAGEKLAKDGILTMSTLKDGKLRFCLPEATQRAWKSSNRNEPARHCVNVPLNGVCSSGASGSGAPGGVPYPQQSG